jgi:hypothetical protein
LDCVNYCGVVRVRHVRVVCLEVAVDMEGEARECHGGVEVVVVGKKFEVESYL